MAAVLAALSPVQRSAAVSWGIQLVFGSAAIALRTEKFFDLVGTSSFSAVALLMLRSSPTPPWPGE